MWIGSDGCLTVITTLGHYSSVGAMRDAWRKMSLAIVRRRPCHVLVFPRSSVPDSLPINQFNNMLIAMSQSLDGVVALAFVTYNGHPNNHDYATGFLEASGVNIAKFTSITQAKSWLSHMQHRDGCPYAK